jgi:hypothetical protein
MTITASFEEQLAQLRRDGFLLIPGALPPDVVAFWKDVLYGMYDRGEYQIRNGVGNVAFEHLLALQPEQARALMAHPSTAPFLRSVLGRQG